MDEILDLVVSADCSEWERKDANELELAVTMGYLSRLDAQRIDNACRVVESCLSRGEVPWDRSWSSWRASE